MKDKLLKKYLSVFFLMSLILIATQDAFAISKLDFFAPVADIADKIGKVKTKIETVYNTQVQKLNAKVQKVAGREGAMIFNYVKKNASSIAASAAKGQFFAGDFTAKGMWNALKSEVGELKFDFAKAQRQLKNYVDSRERQKLDKQNAMNVELSKMQAEHQALNKTMKELEDKGQPIPENVKKRFIELETAIPELQKEIKIVMETNVREGETYNKLRKNISDKQAKIDSLVKKTSEKEIVEMLGKKTTNLFSKKTEDDETKELYDVGTQKFFLGQYEQDNPKNVERIMKLRKQEYYKAVKNVLETSITTQLSLDEIKERSIACTDAATKQAQGVFGAAGIRICVELQNAKVAARYMEILLAQIRLETTQSLQSWSDRHKMEDYGKDMTTFNMDDYVLKKETLFRKLKQKAVSTARDKISNIDASNVF